MLSTFVTGFLAARSYSPQSQRQRRFVLARFIRAVNDCRPDQLTQAAVLNWWASLDDLAPASQRAHLSAVRTFLAHLRRIGELDGDPTAMIVAPRVRHRPPVTIERTDVLVFLATLTSPRDRAGVALMLGCGLRGGDVVNVNVQNVDLDRKVLRVRGKGDKERLVPMPQATVDAVRAYLCHAPATSGPLIRTRGGRRMAAHTWREHLTRKLYDAGVKQHSGDGRSSHVLRRTCATALLREGATITEVQTILGHTSIATTQRYLAETDAESLVSVVERGPLAGLEVGA